MANDANRKVSSSESGGETTTDEQLRRLSHDVKNALHGITVNLEVARTRAARGVADPEALIPFLESAAAQLEVAVRLHKEFAALAFSVAATAAPSNATSRTTR